MSPLDKRRNIFLTGMMGSGKSTSGRIVARQLLYVFIDTDEVIERKEDATVAEIFARMGEPFFRAQERKVMVELAELENQVIATGGGMLIDEENMVTATENGIVIFLDVPIEELARRLATKVDRPLLQQGDTEETLSEIWKTRAKRYQSIECSVRCEGRSPEEMAEEVISLYDKWLLT